MESEFHPVARQQDDAKRNYFQIISSGTNSGIACASGAAVNDSFIACPLGSIVGAVVGGVTGVYFGSHERRDAK